MLALSVPILNDKNTAKNGGTMANDHLRFMAHLPLGFFGWGPQPLGEDHERIRTDRSSGGVIGSRDYIRHSSKRPGRRVSTRHEKPEPLWLPWRLRLLRATSSGWAWTAILGSGLSRPTLRLQALAPLVVVSTISLCLESVWLPHWVISGLEASLSDVRFVPKAYKARCSKILTS